MRPFAEMGDRVSGPPATDDDADLRGPDDIRAGFRYALADSAARQRASTWAHWIARHGRELEAALLEEVCDVDPEAAAHLVIGDVLRRVWANIEDVSSGRASKRWAANRARKKLARGFKVEDLSEMERAAVA